jgi:hypothetical protein
MADIVRERGYPKQHLFTLQDGLLLWQVLPDGERACVAPDCLDDSLGLV